MLMPTPIPQYGHVRKVYYRDGIVEGNPSGPGKEGSLLLDRDKPTQRTMQPSLCILPESLVNIELFPL